MSTLRFFAIKETLNRKPLKITEKKKRSELFGQNVYSQAKTLLDSGFKFYFDGDEIKRIEKNNEQFKQTSVEEEYIDKFFSIPSRGNQKNAIRKNATEIIEYLKKAVSVNVNFNPVSIGKLLKSKGFQTKKVNGLSKYLLILNN